MRSIEKRTAVQARSWQMSFNDLLTILLVFFILIVSISNIRADRIQHVSSSAAAAFGTKQKSDRIEETIRRIGSIEGVDAYLAGGGLSLVLGESLVFQSGSAEVHHSGALMLLGRALRTVPGSIRVEGHTDAVPVAGGSFRSNWELSTQRAVNVVKFLISECGMNPSVFSVAGYADAKPVATNATPEGRALNRRVNIILSLE